MFASPEHVYRHYYQLGSPHVSVMPGPKPVDRGVMVVGTAGHKALQSPRCGADTTRREGEVVDCVCRPHHTGARTAVVLVTHLRRRRARPAGYRAPPPPCYHPAVRAPLAASRPCDTACWRHTPRGPAPHTGGKLSPGAVHIEKVSDNYSPHKCVKLTREAGTGGK